MITTEAHFENIQAIIRNELMSAKHSVYAAVAWFTDEVLFNTLLDLQQKNILVQLCVVQDTINFRLNGLPFNLLETANSKFFAAQNDNMHHKFCVIDERIVITGSYNWTYKAANAGKEENIIVTSGDLELAKQFINEFLKLTGQDFVDNTTDLTRVLKRCKTILTFIELNEIDDVHKQANRLQTEGHLVNAVNEIANHLLLNQFAKATEEINGLLIRYQSVQIYSDPLLQALKLEIRLIEYQIIALEAAKTEVEKKVFDYDRLFNDILGETVRQYLLLKRQLKEKTKQAQPQSESALQECEEANNDYNEFENSYEQTKNETKDYVELSSAEEIARMKKMYREAASLCHPDKFVNDKKKQEEAEEIFKELSNAYQKQDIEKVEVIWKNLKENGLQMMETNTQTDNVTILQQVLSKLKAKYDLLIAALKASEESEAYKIAIANSNLNSYFVSLKIDIEKEIIKLKKEIEVDE